MVDTSMAPAISWKEKRLQEIEEKYDKTYKQKNQEYEKMCDDYDFKTKTRSEERRVGKEC